tara:strand:+ start:202 stop:507 length:306 start_codon:yes stop_codon:yes gene_type:complete
MPNFNKSTGLNLGPERIKSREKDTETAFSEKDLNLMKASTMYKMADGPLTAPGDMYATEVQRSEMTKADDSNEFEDLGNKVGAAFESTKGKSFKDLLGAEE